MDKEERLFQVKKNKFDNDYQKCLNYLNTSIASIVTITIGLLIFYIQAGNIIAVKAHILIGIMSTMAAMLYFSDQLKQISDKISELGE